MNAGVLLVLAIDQIAVAAEFAVATEAGEKSNSDALTYRPALDAGTKSLDPTDDFVARNARPRDWKKSFNSGRIRVTDTACLHANPHVTRAGINKRLGDLRKLARTGERDGLVP
jgi:hypothetical protein